MENSAEIIEAVRAVLKGRVGKETVSDYAVSKALHISRATMSQRKTGRVVTMSDDTAIRAAEIIGQDKTYILAIVHAEQSDRAKQPEAAATWRNLAAVIKSGKRAAMVTGFFLAGALLLSVSPKTAYAAPGGALPSTGDNRTLYIMSKRLAARFRAFLGLFRLHPRPVFGC